MTILILKACSICKVSKSITEFNKNKSKSDGLQTHCKDCNKVISKDYYLKNKDKQLQKASDRNKRIRYENLKFCISYLKERGCIDCGEKNPVCLDFDHVRGIKKFNISRLIASSYCIETIQKEMDKCEIRCANCHRKKTAKDFHWYENSGFYYDYENDVIIQSD